ncbi:nitrilase-related carbon-nitrogen hydrolase [Nocardioides scoriae]|uniref:nitrilase-related carbon-nitrogen hydrolase n=1 Tax=Nocardioides scoriae TaxID=642780 RepID=UPI0018D37900|nr:nitrilase-related carbon-nitrogen hydrolase [Nocardioides scoriae]
MRTDLRVAVAQPDVHALDVAANVAAHAAVVRGARARLVVFPELSLTGYELDAPSLAPTDPRLAPLVEACRATGSVALVGAPVVVAGDRSSLEHIGTLRVDRAGVATAYLKVSLGDAEAERFAPGPGPVAIDVDGWRVGLATCRDTGIAAHVAATAALGLDLYAAGVVHHAHERAELSHRARAIAAATGAPVALASCAAPTGEGYAATAGHSSVHDRHGALLVEAGAATGWVAVTLRATAGETPDGPRD